MENINQNSTPKHSATGSPYLCYAGHIRSRRNKINQGWVVIYRAAEQKIDVDGETYAVVCETHHTILGTGNLQLALPLLKFPDFCAECMAEYHNRTTS